MDFDDFRLKGSDVYIRVERASLTVAPKGRLHTAWFRVEDVPDEMKNYRGICEIGLLVGAVDVVDMQILDPKP